MSDDVSIFMISLCYVHHPRCVPRKNFFIRDPLMSIVSSFPRDADGKGRQKNKHVAFSGTMSDSDACLVRNVLVRHLGDSVPECFSPRFFQLRDIGDERIPTILMPRELFFLRYDVRGRKDLRPRTPPPESVHPYAATGRTETCRRAPRRFRRRRRHGKTDSTPFF